MPSPYHHLYEIPDDELILSYNLSRAMVHDPDPIVAAYELGARGMFEAEIFDRMICAEILNDPGFGSIA